MNNLNSVILEGEIFTPARRRGVDGEFVSFHMRSIEKREEHDIYTDIRVQSSGKLASTVEEFGGEGRSVRVVGKLRWDGVDHYLQGEHMEFKPPIGR